MWCALLIVYTGSIVDNYPLSRHLNYYFLSLSAKIRDPPPEGELFIYGVHLWGCGFEKTATLELQDIPPKSPVPTSLPLIHLSLIPRTDPVVTVHPAEAKTPVQFYCPCFVSGCSRSEQKDGGRESRALFHMEISANEVPPGKWAMRNLFCTLWPF